MSQKVRCVSRLVLTLAIAWPCISNGFAVTFECKAKCAIEWAQSCPPKPAGYRCPTSTWGGCCLGFVEEAYGAGLWLNSACDLLKLLRSQGQIHADLNAPRGALVFWECWVGGGDGHVGISLGGGQFISALSEHGCACDICTKNLPFLSGYAGWAYPPADWPGRSCPCQNPPGPPNLISPNNVWFKHSPSITMVVSPGSGGTPTQYNYRVWGGIVRPGPPYGYSGTNPTITPPPPIYGYYQWTASASNGDGTSTEPAPLGFYVNDPPAIPTPSPSSPAYHNSLGTAVPMYWNDVSSTSRDGIRDQLRYRVAMRRGDGGWSWDSDYTISGTQTSRTVPVEGRYYWKVAAGEGPPSAWADGGWDTLGFSSEASAIVDARPPQYVSHSFSPESPGRLSTVNISVAASDTNPDPTTTVSGVKTITVLVDGQQVGIIPGASGAVDWDTRGVAEGWHDLTLIIVDNAANSTVKVLPHAYLLDRTPPFPPQNVRGEGASSAVDLAWDETTDTWTNVQGYNVYRAPAAAGPYANVSGGLLPPDETCFRDDNGGSRLTNVTRYWYKVTAVDSTNPDGNENAQESVAAVPLTAGLRGDITGDDVVDIEDIIHSIRIAVGRDWPTDGQRDLADINKDGLVDVGDVVLVVRRALSLDPLPPLICQLAASAPPADYRGSDGGLLLRPTKWTGPSPVWVPTSFRVKAGGTVDVPIYLNRVSGVAGIQVYLAGDERVRLAKAASGQLIAGSRNWTIHANAAPPQPKVIATSGFSLASVRADGRACILTLTLSVQQTGPRSQRVPVRLLGKLVDQNGRLVAPFDSRTTLLVGPG